jgi:hypothetical protein
MTLEAVTVEAKGFGAGSRARRWLLADVRNPGLMWRVAAGAGVAFIFFTAIKTLFGGIFQSWATYGFHDWDAHSAYRYATVASIRRYHELPWWNPWLGGGFPAWAYVEGATNLVSPYLPLYLTFPVQVAERLEILGATLTGLFSSFALAGRFTRSAALRALVAVTYAVNGRWALQTAVGHTWHMQYAWLPLALYFFDLSIRPDRKHYAFASAGALAMLIYMGGIYPLPHTALAMIVYAFGLAAVQRSLLPFARLAVAGVSGIGLAAPKLFPLVDLMMRYPRKIESTEAIDLGQLMAMMTDPNQSYSIAPVAVPRWGWHEYGIYVGPWVVVAMVVGFVCARDVRAIPLKIAGLLFFLLGMGAFHPRAPWTLLHTMPVFSSQHVPTRFLFPAVLFAMLVFAVFAGSLLDRMIVARGWVDLMLLVPVYAVAYDIAKVGRKSTEHSFYMEAPPIQAAAEFRQHNTNPYNYSPSDWAGASLLGEFGNIGLIGAYGLPTLEPGAIGTEQAYRGEAYVVSTNPDADHKSEAHVVSFTANTAVVEFSNAPPNAKLVYNMNYDPSWRADGKPALELERAVASPITGPKGRVRFSYFPRMLPWGLLVFAMTVGLNVGLPGVFRRWRPAKTQRGKA